MRFEIWLGAHYSHFDHGLLHLDDGSTQPLKGWIHTATYGPDTILIADEDRYIYADFPVRWYIEENGLAFYCWDDDIKTIVFHNDAGKDLEISRFGILKVGETREIRREEFYGHQ